MSQTDDRIKVPVNGHRPALEAKPTPAAPGSVAPAGTVPESARLAASPTQLAVGFGAVAGLVALVLGALWRRRR